MADDTQPAYDPTALDPTALDPEADAVSRRRARKWWWAAGGLVFVVALVMMYMGRQSGTDIPPAPRAFCVAAKAYEDEIARQQIAYKKDIEKHIEYVADIAATAPKAVKADAEFFLAQLERVQAAPNAKAREKVQQQLEADPTVEARVDNVTRYWNQGCGVFDRRGGI